MNNKFLKVENRKIAIVSPMNEQNRNYTYGDGKLTTKLIPTYSGLYLIGEVTYEEEHARIVYKIKVGKGKNLQSRLKSYPTHSTSLSLFDYKYVHPKSLTKAEKYFQQILSNYSWRIGNTEWYVVSEKNYQTLKRYGFSGFNKLNT